MSLYINHGKHDNIFKNQDKLNEPNQSYFKREYFAELVKNQLEVNQSLQNSIYGLKTIIDANERTQSTKWNEINTRLTDLKEINLRHDHQQRYLVDQVNKIETDNKNLQKNLEENRLSDQEILEQIEKLSKSNLEIVNQLENYYKDNQEFFQLMEDQQEVQKQMAEQITKQEVDQEKVLSRIENQEALMEKITRQIDYFRSILFERTNYLAEKIENGYHNTSSYVTKLISSEKKKEDRVSK
ncbi:hypothetical protein VBD025_18020 [Virgibacillus flavescens]|uniref:hypothetical protein n=1 Tax=Virgibacillus flavescens TaxID=1611422 RepID=UPI003D3340F4